MRITPHEFQQEDLRVHTFLADVPLHDVWAVRLHGGGEGRTLREVRDLMAGVQPSQVNPVVASLFRLRRGLGRVFGWDAPKHEAAVASFVHRLTPADRARSLVTPGQNGGLFSAVYAFENESLEEIRNGTVHAFSATALKQVADGYVMYWAIYVKRINWRTPVYMAMIDPFRRGVIYPAMIAHIERAWARTGGQAASSNGSAASNGCTRMNQLPRRSATSMGAPCTFGGRRMGRWRVAPER